MKPIENLTKVTLGIFAGRPVTAGSINIAAEAARSDDPSSFLTPDLAERFLDEYNRVNNIDCDYGGYLEDRASFYEGFDAIPSDKAVHQGIDVSAHAGTPLTITHRAKLVRAVHGSEIDPKDQEGGWGGVLYFELEKPVGDITHFLYGHLARADIEAMRARVGETFNPGDIVAHVGAPDENGGWVPHTHVQAFSQKSWEATKQGKLDEEVLGYSDLEKAKIFPNPMPILLAP